MTPSATTVPPQVQAARAESFMYVLKRGWLTGKQINEAQVFGGKAARQKAKHE